jgi:rSAM/selenodomain-associated transferase 1
VKTRLAPYLGEDAAARLQQQLIERTVAMACGAAVAPVELWLAGKDSHPCIQGLMKRFAITVRVQQGADLGERMLHAATAALEQAQRVVLIGTDSPAMGSDTLQQAFAALDGHDVVYGPAEDGGYTLVGLKRPWPELFRDIEWGSGEVLQQSLSKAEALDLRVARLALGWDLDRPEDYRRALAGAWITDVR